MSINPELNLIFIHTLAPLIEVFNHLTERIIGDIKLFHILDEPLLESIKQNGKVNTFHANRLLSHINSAEKLHAVAVLITCSTLSPALNLIHTKINIPVVKIDEAMIAQAVLNGSRIGVIATAFSTLEPTRCLLEEKARQKSKSIEIKMQLVDQALDLLLQGKGQEHDQLVKSAILDLSNNVDLVILAQASMARVLDVIPDEKRNVPILSSPYLALQQIKSLIMKEDMNDLMKKQKQQKKEIING